MRIDVEAGTQGRFPRMCLVQESLQWNGEMLCLGWTDRCGWRTTSVWGCWKADWREQLATWPVGWLAIDPMSVEQSVNGSIWCGSLPSDEHIRGSAVCVCSPDISLHMCCCRSVITEHLQSWKLPLFIPLFRAEREATVSGSHCLTIPCLVSLSFTHKHEWLFEWIYHITVLVCVCMSG